MVVAAVLVEVEHHPAAKRTAATSRADNERGLGEKAVTGAVGETVQHGKSSPVEVQLENHPFISATAQRSRSIKGAVQTLYQTRVWISAVVRRFGERMNDRE